MTAPRDFPSASSSSRSCLSSRSSPARTPHGYSSSVWSPGLVARYESSLTEMPYNGVAHNLRGSPPGSLREIPAAARFLKPRFPSGLGRSLRGGVPFLTRPTPRLVQGLVIRRAGQSPEIARLAEAHRRKGLRRSPANGFRPRRQEARTSLAPRASPQEGGETKPTEPRFDERPREQRPAHRRRHSLRPRADLR